MTIVFSAVSARILIFEEKIEKLPFPWPSAGGLPGRQQRSASAASVPERPGQRTHPRHPRGGVPAERGAGGHGAGLLHLGDHLLVRRVLVPTIL